MISPAIAGNDSRCGMALRLFHFSAAWSNFPKTRAGSTGRCNSGLEFTRRSFKAQGFSRALIEAQSYLVEIGLRVGGQVGLHGEVLS
jgi:hypothetical protein